MTPKDISTVKEALEVIGWKGGGLYPWDGTNIDKLIVVIEAARAYVEAAPTPPGDSGWRDIATAPMDGKTWIICDRPSFDTYAVAISEKTGDVLEPISGRSWLPTHWLPLLPPPAPPTGKGE